MNDIRLVTSTLLSERIPQLITEMDDKLEHARDAVSDLMATPDEIEGMEYRDLKRMEQELSRAKRECEDARRDFSRAWDAPKKQIEGFYNEQLQDISELHRIYRTERVSRDERERADRYEFLADYLLGELEANGIEGLPIDPDTLIKPEWLNRTFPANKAQRLITDAVIRTVNDLRVLGSVNLHDPQTAKAEYMRTLDLNKALQADKAAKERDRVAETLSETLGTDKWKITAMFSSDRSDALSARQSVQDALDGLGIEAEVILHAC